MQDYKSVGWSLSRGMPSPPEGLYMWIILLGELHKIFWSVLHKSYEWLCRQLELRTFQTSVASELNQMSCFPNSYALLFAVADLMFFCFIFCTVFIFLTLAAPCGLRGCTNRAYFVSWPEVVKAVPNQGVDCFVSQGSFLCFSFVFLVYVVLCFIVLVVSTSAVDCLERLVSEMTCYVASGTLNPTHSLTHSNTGIVFQNRILPVIGCKLIFHLDRLHLTAVLCRVSGNEKSTWVLWNLSDSWSGVWSDIAGCFEQSVYLLFIATLFQTVRHIFTVLLWPWHCQIVETICPSVHSPHKFVIAI